MPKEQVGPLWCLIGNVKAPGTKHFSTGTKVYCLPAQWGDGYERIIVFGLHRQSKKIIKLIMRSKGIENWRAKLVYKPSIIRRIKEFDDSEPYRSIWEGSAHAYEMATSILTHAVASHKTRAGGTLETSLKNAVKICGLTRPEDVASAIEHGAAFLGFIVECPSKRRLSVAEAAALALPAIGLAARVAVTVNPDDDLIDRILSQMQPDYIQLHGDETPARAADIARRVKVIKAVGIASDEDMKTAETYAGVADFILYDAKPPKGDVVRGGHGIAIDWNIIANAPTPKTFAVAGGLNPENVSRALAATRAPIVDVSSGVEASAGVKDLLKIQAFMDAVQNG